MKLNRMKDMYLLFLYFAGIIISFYYEIKGHSYGISGLGIIAAIFMSVALIHDFILQLKREEEYRKVKE